VTTAEAACREAIASGDRSAWMPLAAVLAVQLGREEEAEKACREALATGDNGAWIVLGNVLVAQPGREEEAEDAYRKAIAAGYNSGWLGVGNVLLERRGCEKGAKAAYREAIKANVDAETRAGARRGEVLARRTRSTRRTKFALVALVVIAFVVNLIFKDDSSEAWTVLGNLDGVVFWLALFALPVALFVEQAQVGGVLRDRRHRRRARRRTTRPAATGAAIPGRRRVGSATAALRRLGERGRAPRAQLERLFPSLYDARYAAQGIARVVWPLVGPVLTGLLVAPILLLLAALAQALGLEAPAIDLPSIDLPSIDAPDIPDPNITAPGWLRAIGDVLALLSQYLFAAVVVILGIRRTIEVRRKRIQAEQLGRQELLRRLAIALSNTEATARARGAGTARVGSVLEQELEYQRAPAHVPRLWRRKRQEQP